jgi:hypothetical protein
MELAAILFCLFFAMNIGASGAAASDSAADRLNDFSAADNRP